MPMARSTPAQKPRGCASKISMSPLLSMVAFMLISDPSRLHHRQDFRLENDGESRQGMIKVEQGVFLVFFQQGAGEFRAGGVGEGNAATRLFFQLARQGIERHAAN